MVPASVVGFDRRACEKGQGLYEDLHQKIQASEYLHADETSWRVDGKGAWLWYVGQAELAYFHVDAHRSGEVAQAVIGPLFEGVLNTDDYAAYNGVRVSARQSCLAHPLRDAREAQKLIESLEDKAPVSAPAKGFIARAKQFLEKLCQIGRQLRQGTLSPKQATGLKSPFQSQLRRLCAKPLTWKPAETLRSRLWKQRGCLLTFLDHPQIEPTNNQAEQSLRRSVILRKITFGSRSSEGAHRHAVLTSLVMTAQRQGRDARAAVEALFTQAPSVLRKAFYRQGQPKRGPHHSASVPRNKKSCRSCRGCGKDPPVR
jgi:transposase